MWSAFKKCEQGRNIGLVSELAFDERNVVSGIQMHQMESLEVAQGTFSNVQQNPDQASENWLHLNQLHKSIIICCFLFFTSTTVFTT